MDPSDAVKKDQEAFEKDLEEMIAGILDGSSGSNTISATSSPPHSPVNGDEKTSHKRSSSAVSPATECSPASPSRKRVKIEPTAPSFRLHMHPLRQALLNENSASSASSGDASIDCKGSHRHDSSATKANATPLGLMPGKTGGPRTHSTLTNTVRRQWDSRKGDLGYEELLKHRRNEQGRLTTVDRYVPAWTGSSAKPSKTGNTFPYEKLPETVRDKILSLLLVSANPIEIDFAWLRPFVKGHARVPVVTQKLDGEDGSSYVAPISWPKLLREVEAMRSDMAQFKYSLEVRGDKTKARRSPARHLTTFLFRVSRKVHRAATSIFYGQNIFHFSYPPAAWMHLESFLETVGARNVQSLKHLRITAPMFSRVMQEDYLEGAMLDMIQPATRMAVITSTSRDRLRCAIKYSVEKLMVAGTLETLAIDLENPMAADLWTGRYTNDKRLISVAEAEEHVERKATAVALLKQASDALTAKGNKPVVTLRHFGKPSRPDVNEFRRRLAGLNAEAAKYGWAVDSRLQHGK